MTTRPIPQCLTCTHWVSPLDRADLNAFENEPTQICSAFPLPGGIPEDIWWNRFDHRQPHAGDGGVRWEPLGGADFPEWAMSQAR